MPSPSSVVDIRLLEHCIREDLGENAKRAMAVLDPLPITLTNWPEDKTILVDCENHPGHPEWGVRQLHFSKHLFIEREDFQEDPPKKFFRLAPGREVRLKSAYIIRCDQVIKDENGQVKELLCSVDLNSLSGQEGANRKVKGTLHWVDARTALPAELRVYDYMFPEDPDGGEDAQGEAMDEEETETKRDILASFNRDSIRLYPNALLESSLGQAKVGDRFQFMRQGYYVKDRDSTADKAVFNCTVSLKDSYKP